MRKLIRPRAEDWMGLSLLALIGGGMFAFRKLAVVPLMAIGLCSAANAPVFCAHRAALMWLQYQQAFGWAALLCGSVGFAFGRRWPGMLAIAVGITAVMQYNAATGIIGLALGLVAAIGLLNGRSKRDSLARAAFTATGPE
ncbi:MAG TPA: hypothetical protein VNC39_14675 [Acidocella sp.]|jgi:hypothetical protein|uniref:hypothetical protein n=1 Tax=Acidocella sp. TaxID=50710 RepID=UPI002CDCAB16|nr:hypothetical protein [Acidocella sp.]HVE23213.1 hypothetical protein [Acidocella sp.]